MKHKSTVFSRLIQMGPREVGTRALQTVLQRRDALYHSLGWRPRSSRVIGREIIAGRFFFDEDAIPAIVEKFREILPNEVEGLLERADRICRHEFDLLGYSDISYGTQIDWSRDAVHDRKAPLIPWYRIDLFDFSAVGDPKITWELNRHQHLVTLAKAWWLTSDDRFVHELIAQWESWIEQNPYPLGINWASSLEVAFRSISWLWVLSLLSKHVLLTARLQRKICVELGLHGAHIRRYLSTYSSPNTHLLGEAVALMFIGQLCPELGDSAHWRELGWKIVREQLQRQVLPDGMHFEQSTYYHVYALDFFLHSRILAARNGLVVRDQYDEALQRMLEGLASLCSFGNPPRFGDDDGGRVFDGRRNRAEHLADPLATGAVLFGRGEWKRACQAKLREETLWLLGPEAVQKFDQLPAECSPSVQVFPSAGIYRFSDSESEVILDAGPHGVGRGGHGHADALSLAWKVDGKEVLCDPGTGSYSEAKGRDLLRSTAAHNTLEVDDRSQSDPIAPFAWHDLVQSKVSVCITAEGFDLLRARHTGYSRLPQPVFHTRWLFHSNNDFSLVRDVVEGSGTHKLKLSWHIANGLNAQIRSDGHVILDDRGQTAACLYFSADGRWNSGLEEGWISPAYGIREEALVLRLTRSAALPAEIATVLIPRALADENVALRYEEAGSAAGGATVYRLLRGKLVDQLLFNDDGRSWRFKDWESDAEFLRIQFNDDDVIRISAVSVSRLRFNGREIINEVSRLSWLDWKKGSPVHASSAPGDRTVEAFRKLIAQGSSVTGKVNA